MNKSKPTEVGHDSMASNPSEVVIVTPAIRQMDLHSPTHTR